MSPSRPTKSWPGSGRCAGMTFLASTRTTADWFGEFQLKVGYRRWSEHPSTGRRRTPYSRRSISRRVRAPMHIAVESARAYLDVHVQWAIHVGRARPPRRDSGRTDRTGLATGHDKYNPVTTCSCYHSRQPCVGPLCSVPPLQPQHRHRFLDETRARGLQS